MTNKKMFNHLKNKTRDEMSIITQIILIISNGDEEKNLEKLNKFFEDEDTRGLYPTPLENVIFRKMHTSIITRYNSGTKVFSSELYLGAYNLLPEQSFIKHYQSIKWEWKDTVQLLMMTDDSDYFEEISHGPPPIEKGRFDT